MRNFVLWPLLNCIKHPLILLIANKCKKITLSSCNLRSGWQIQVSERTNKNNKIRRDIRLGSIE